MLLLQGHWMLYLVDDYIHQLRQSSFIIQEHERQQRRLGLLVEEESWLEGKFTFLFSLILKTSCSSSFFIYFNLFPGL
ncbi:hypothetical protein VNO77_05387 [Canavalia gladiata]|uniref:Uncharacterized protein n=1 Tax=Canavalia gladiata TaxID=3824 RepID=A0AAN9N3E6_CANGL